MNPSKKGINAKLDSLRDEYLNSPSGKPSDDAWAAYEAAIRSAKESGGGTSQCSCLRCGGKWNKRVEDRPKQCPYCKQRKWDTVARKRGTGCRVDCKRSVDGTTDYVRLLESGYRVVKSEPNGIVLMVR